jgi:hypothetical protein
MIELNIDIIIRALTIDVIVAAIINNIIIEAICVGFSQKI